jgi:hypothetical protein
MTSRNADFAVLAALETGLLKEIQHRTTDIINDISQRINASLREIILTVESSARDLEECIKQDILDAKSSGASKLLYANDFNLSDKLANGSDKVKVGMKDLKKCRDSNRSSIRNISNATKQAGGQVSLGASTNVKIGLKEWKEWKIKKNLPYSNPIISIPIKEESAKKDLPTNKINTAEGMQCIFLEDCLKTENVESEDDRYASSLNRGGNEKKD